MSNKATLVVNVYGNDVFELRRALDEEIIRVLGLEGSPGFMPGAPQYAEVYSMDITESPVEPVHGRYRAECHVGLMEDMNQGLKAFWDCGMWMLMQLTIDGDRVAHKGARRSHGLAPKVEGPYYSTAAELVAEAKRRFRP